MFEKLIQVDQCSPGMSVFIGHGDNELAVFHLQDPDRFVVTANACPHAGGNLSAGTLQHHTVTCPVHHWKFDLDTGYCVSTEDAYMKRYACKVEGDDLLVDLSRPLSLSPPPRYDF